MPGPTTKPRKNPYAKAIAAYYAALKEFEFQHVIHESATRSAFQTLLAEAARTNKWTLVPELGDKFKGKTIRPDGTLKDFMNLPRGHWEAKDTSDRLDEEIAKKIKKGYPLGNIIFEDTRTAVLMQNKSEVMRVDLTDPEKLANLLKTFFDHIEPQIESFEKAITEFKERVPELAEGLKGEVSKAHDSNKPFKEAFARFFELCKTSLNPNISKSAVDDMLVQHLLTERLIRVVFDNPEFTQRNVIALEIEKVIAALTSQSFSRDIFLKRLDRFYVAIENAARTITDWSDKQHFLNTIYERFFQGYSMKLADTMGIVYTPQPIVDFMCASVAEVLEKEFGKTLGSPDVNILDPCTGTGNFIINLMRRIPKRDLPRVYRQQLFANEIMLMPYYIAALNIEHEYSELAGEYQTFEGLCFVDTLDLAEARQAEMSFMTAKNTERVERQKRTPITVIIGNPPYNAHQMNENDNNKNRKYAVLDARIRSTYAADSTATLKAALADPYVKFFRFATDRLEGRDGIVCFVSNNSFIEQNAFDGMRKHLASNFTRVFHIDLHGNVRHNPTHSGTAYNVFGIQVGVGITVAVRLQSQQDRKVFYAEVPEPLRRLDKLHRLNEFRSIGYMNWDEIKPDIKYNWLGGGDPNTFAQGLPLATKSGKASENKQVENLFKLFGPGVNSSRDDVVYGFERSLLISTVDAFCDQYFAEVDRYRRKGGDQEIDAFIDHNKLKWSSTLKLHLKRGTEARFDERKIKPAPYRPYTLRLLYHDPIINDRPGLFPQFFPAISADDNRVIALTNPGSEKAFMLLISEHVVDYHLVGAGAGAMCFPFYVYNEDGTNRRENITDWSLDQFRSQYKDKSISKWDIFHYVYGLLHHPGYRTKFADNLKRELPRIPYAPALSERSESNGPASGFWAFQRAGQSLAGLHLDYEKLEPWPLKWIETAGIPLSYRVEKMKLSKDKTTLTVNESLALGIIPAEVFEYRLGNRSALDWVIDQYQVSTDKRSGIVSDPNREDDPEYIVRLVGQVVRVSIETVKIVKGLPEAFS